MTDGTTRHLNYIYGGGKLIAIFEQKSGGDKMHFVYTDRQGSLRCITDATGVVEQRLSFDAWGNRRNYETGAPLTAAELAAATALTSRGYTGHEHIDAMVLINMNGRIYDPALGMFLSPDNYVQSPTNSQNFNRYSYCVNNPLMYTDPSGDIFWVMPYLSWSPKNGLSGGITFGIGIPNSAISASVTVGYSASNGGNWYASAGVSVGVFTFYGGYGSSSGWFGGVSAGIIVPGKEPGWDANSNMLSVGISYSENGGFSSNISVFSYSGGEWVADPSFTGGYSFNNAKQLAEAKRREEIATFYKNFKIEVEYETPHLITDGQLLQMAVNPTEIEEITITAKRGSGSGFNVESAVNTLNKNSLSESSGYCARYVRYAIEAGGINTNGRPGSAKDYGYFLSNKGFKQIAMDNYKAQEGDIAVMNKFAGKKDHPHGHIQMYNGKQWVSDFKQNNFWPGSDYRNHTPTTIILRWNNVLTVKKLD